MTTTPNGVATLPLLDRGVWNAPYLKNGLSALIMVTSKGELIGPISLPPHLERAKAERALESLLDLIDPSPVLSLLR